MEIFCIRFVLSFSQFMWLAHLPLLLPPIFASIFVLGLRVGLLLVPTWTQVSKGYSLLASVCAIFLMTLFLTISNIDIPNAIIISLFLSIASFLIRKNTSKIVSHASFNKIALHGGSLFAGLIVIFSVKNLSYFYSGIVLASLIAAFLSLKFFRKSIKNESNVYQLSWRDSTPILRLFWFSTGIAMGLRSYSPYILLPAILIAKTGELPSEFGVWMMVYSGLVILWQIPSGRGFQSTLQLSLSYLALGCLVLGVVSISGFSSSKLMIWIWLLLTSSQELFAATLDVEANKENGLFYKEVGVGFGGGLGVLLAQFEQGPLFIAALGLSSLAIGYFYRTKKQSLET